MLNDISTLANKALINAVTAKPQTKENLLDKCTKAALYDFAAYKKLDESDTREWYEMTIKRNFCDRNGNKIENWKGALINFCKAKTAHRNSKGGNR